MQLLEEAFWLLCPAFTQHLKYEETGLDECE